MSNQPHNQKIQFENFKQELEEAEITVQTGMLNISENMIGFQFHGYELVLVDNGHWFVTDTSGG